MFSIMLPGLMSPKLGFLLALAFLALFRSAWKWQIVKWSSRDKSGKIGDEINLFAWRTRNICITAVLTKISIFVEIFFFLFILFSRMRSIIFFFLNFSINSNFSKRIKITERQYDILLIGYYCRGRCLIYGKQIKAISDNRIELLNFEPNKFIHLYKDIKSG